MKQAKIILFFLFIAIKVQSQFVFIPDSAFRNYLVTNGISSCMQGDSLDTTCTAVLNLIDMNCSTLGIHNLEGVQYFKKLQTLDCSGNFLTTLPALPDSLEALRCHTNQLTGLPYLPASLQEIRCGNNLLHSLPDLPVNLYVLDCYSNLLDSLPILPGMLQFLNCSINHLFNLPVIPASVNYMDCSVNYLTTLPSLPVQLYFLDCSYNKLNGITTLPPNLNYLYCVKDSLYSLPPLPTSLTDLLVSANHLSVIPNLPPGLNRLDCGWNLLTSLPSLPGSLTSLYFSDNYIGSLPPLPEGLKFLQFDNNQISHIDSFPDSLYEISCSNNLLTALPPLSKNLTQLMIENNSISQLPALHDTMEFLYFGGNPISCLPPVHKIRWCSLYGYTLLNCIPNIIQIDTCWNCLLDTFPLCQPSSGCPVDWSISGTVYHDANNNCLRDSTEEALHDIPVMLDSAGVLLQTFLTNNAGQYSFRAQLGTYTVKIDTAHAPFPLYCPASFYQTSVLTAMDSTDNGLNFGMQCPGGYDLVATSITPSSMFRPGKVREIYISAGDAMGKNGFSCFDGSGWVQIILTGPVSYLSVAAGALIPSFVSGDTIRWNISDFSTVDPLHAFNLVVLVSPTATVNDVICFNLVIRPVAGDLHPGDNQLTSCFPVRNSLDPNEKLMSPETVADTSDYWFTFTVFFQNTGNAPAEDIYILDSLDQNLDPLSFEFLASSHPVVTQLLPHSVLRFNFNGINLIDSTTNEQGSHGFVKFKIKRKDGTGIGTTISNTANIYFDLNSPVQTNTVSATITSLLALNEIKNFHAEVYPNPATETIHVFSSGSSIETIDVYNLTGELIGSYAVNNKREMTINIRSYSPGLYFLKLIGEKNWGVGKFVKEGN